MCSLPQTSSFLPCVWNHHANCHFLAPLQLAIYSPADRLQPHRFKADESYQVRGQQIEAGYGRRRGEVWQGGIHCNNRQGSAPTSQVPVACLEAGGSILCCPWLLRVPGTTTHSCCSICWYCRGRAAALRCSLRCMQRPGMGTHAAWCRQLRNGSPVQAPLLAGCPVRGYLELSPHTSGMQHSRAMGCAPEPPASPLSPLLPFRCTAFTGRAASVLCCPAPASPPACLQVGGPDMTPVQCYLDVEGIVKLAKEQGVDVVHPG